MKAVDTENIIHSRQRLRFLAIINISLVFVFLAIKDYFTQPHASWIHFLHFALQPVAILVSIMDHIIILQYTRFACMLVTAIDGVVCLLNIIAISRCTMQPTAQCFDRLIESFIWIVLSVIFTLVDILIIFQLSNLMHQIQQKKTNVTNAKSQIKINIKKMEILHTFLIPQDIIFAFITIARTRTVPIYWLGISHIFIDPYVIWSGRSESKTLFLFRRAVYIVLLSLNVILFILNLEFQDRDVWDWLSLFMIGTYVCIDIILYVLVEEVLNSIKSIKLS